MGQIPPRNIPRHHGFLLYGSSSEGTNRGNRARPQGAETAGRRFADRRAAAGLTVEAWPAATNPRPDWRWVLQAGRVQKQLWDRKSRPGVHGWRGRVAGRRVLFRPRTPPADCPPSLWPARRLAHAVMAFTLVVCVSVLFGVLPALAACSNIDLRLFHWPAGIIAGGEPVPGD